jgi:hypothetical protein
MIIKATQEEIMEGVNGGCLACGEIKYGMVEPDAEKYECEECGENEVYGLEQLLLMGKLEIEDEE